MLADAPKRRAWREELKIRVSPVRFRPWPLRGSDALRSKSLRCQPPAVFLVLVALRAARDLFGSALRDLRGSWKVLAITDLAYKAIAVALLMPATTLVLYWLRAGTSQRVVADTDIAMFFLTTPTGIVTLLLGGSLIVAITAVEASCLMAVGVGASQDIRLNGRGALRFGAANALNVLRLSGHMVLRVMVGVVPFGIAAGLVYVTLLRA